MAVGFLFSSFDGRLHNSFYALVALPTSLRELNHVILLARSGD
jgi:hypothetical protein